MEPYSVVEVRHAATGGIEAIINGPGISPAGIPYWFTAEEQVYPFIENLNLSYREARRLGTCSRRARSRQRIHKGVHPFSAASSH
jgi:hypothetical protein